MRKRSRKEVSKGKKKQSKPDSDEEGSAEESGNQFCALSTLVFIRSATETVPFPTRLPREFTWVVVLLQGYNAL